ncbi:MAG: hypothetical protein ACFFAS_06170 [Promethearchaeota archaeon]
MSVIIPKKVYKTIVAAAVRFANAKIPKDDWLEVSGIFIGRNEGKGKKARVIVTEAYPIMHQELDKEAVIDQYKWTDEDYLSLALIDDEAICHDPPEFTVGWWHTHPGFKIMMSHIDIRTTLSYQTNNPLAISLVFNPERLTRQIEPADKKGDPDIKLKNDPGFKIFRLDDVEKGIQASYSEVDFEIEGFESIEQMLVEMQKFVVDVTMNLPKEEVVETYNDTVDKMINKLTAQVQGVDEYLQTLVRKGEQARVHEVLETQKKEIRKYIDDTSVRLDNIQEFREYLEYKERGSLIPQINEILSRWENTSHKLDSTLDTIAKKF